MPTYDYICERCGLRTEVMHGLHASGPEACPACGGGPMRKALHPPAIHFKGTGWAKKERAAAGTPARDATAPPAAKSPADSGSGAAEPAAANDAQPPAKTGSSAPAAAKPSEA